MRLSKIAWLILGVSISILGAVGLYLIYQDEIDEQDTLKGSIAAAQATLPTIIAERNDLEGQLAELEDDLAEAEALLAEAETLFPEDIQSIYYGDLLFYWAEVVNLKVTSFTSTEPFSYVVDNINYMAYTFTVVVEGDYVEYIMSYLTRIEFNEDFITAKIDTVTTSIADPEAEVPEATSASITLTILGYGGE